MHTVHRIVMCWSVCVGLATAAAADELLVDEHFSAGRLPERWFCDSTALMWSPDGLQTGAATGFIIPLPNREWSGLRVELELAGGTSVKCSADGVLTMIVSPAANKYPRHQVLYDQHVLAATTTKPIAEDKTKIVFHFERDRLWADIDGRDIVAFGNPRGEPFGGAVHFAFRGDATVRRLRIFGEGISSPVESTSLPRDASHARKSSQSLEVAIDFSDDLIRAPFDVSTFDRLFAELASWGTKRVHWIDTGTHAQGMLDHFPNGVPAHAEQTYKNVGDLFPAAVRAAHRHHIEIFALFKPFDMGLRWSYGDGTPEAKERGRLNRIGGPVGVITHFAAEHREFMMARKPGAYGPAENPVWTRLDLVKEDDQRAALSVEDIRLYVSDDNAVYRPYEGSIRREEVVEGYPLYEPTHSGVRTVAERRRRRVLRLDGLVITQPYMAVAVTGRERSFANRWCDLVHVYGPKGEERRLTYAAMPRYVAPGKASAHYPWDVGFEFDRFPGSPTANFGGGYDAVGEPYVLDGGSGVIAVARGKARDTLAAMSPSFPETRRHWLDWIAAACDAGADGVEVRLGNHNQDFAWVEYGFEQPVRDEFLKRYGIDIWTTDDFDRTAWRRLRGEAFTQFIHDARKLTRDRRKQFGLHMESVVDAPPELGGGMNIHWNWRAWLRDAAPDTVSVKGVRPDSRFAREVLSLAHSQAIPVTYIPYAINWFSDYRSVERKPGGAELVDKLIEASRAAGFEAFQFYECAVAVAARSDGSIAMQEHALREIFRKRFVAKP